MKRARDAKVVWQQSLKIIAFFWHFTEVVFFVLVLRLAFSISGLHGMWVKRRNRDVPGNMLKVSHAVSSLLPPFPQGTVTEEKSKATHHVYPSPTSMDDGKVAFQFLSGNSLVTKFH